MAPIERQESIISLAGKIGVDPSILEKSLERYQIEESLFISEQGYFHIQFLPINPEFEFGEFRTAHRVTISTRVSESGKVEIDRGSVIDETIEKDLLITAIALLLPSKLSIDPELLAVAKSSIELMNS
jgi:hypothetical protein